jgi:hypothetical protein
MEQTNYWVWRIDPNFRNQDRERVMGHYGVPAGFILIFVKLIFVVVIFASNELCTRDVLVHFGWHFQSSLVVFCWMC